MNFKYISIILSIILLVSSIVIKKLRHENNIFIENNKALTTYLDSSKTTNRMLKLTVDQLYYLNDSIVNKLDSIRNLLNIKDKNLKELQYIGIESKKIDTIIFKDTLFIKSIKVDTTIGDKWVSTRLCLNYPNEIILSPTYNSRLYIISSYKKETIYPPKRFFIARWFQRKHTVVDLNIIDENPYSRIKEQRFIEIIK